jgi:hypothetical protein
MKLLACGLALLGLVGCSSEVSTTGSGGGNEGGGGDGGAGGGECFAPTERVALRLPICSGAEPGMDLTGALDGTVTAVTDGIRVTGVGDPPETIDVLGVAPAVPDGTLVTLTYACSPGFYGEPGQAVQLQNLPMLDATTNPTESGTRLWYFAAGGGETYFLESFPFAYDFESQCTTGEFPDGYRSPNTVLLSGTGFDVRIEPGQTVAFTASGGEQAGAYSFENVNATFIGYPGGDAASEFNVELVRAD